MQRSSCIEHASCISAAGEQADLVVLRQEASIEAACAVPGDDAADDIHVAHALLLAAVLAGQLDPPPHQVQGEGAGGREDTRHAPAR